MCLQKLERTIEEFTKPFIAEDGAVILGSKITTVFVVDAKTGKLIRTYKSPDSLTELHIHEEENGLHEYDTVAEKQSKSGLRNPTELQQTGLQHLFITRTDYILKSYRPNSSRISWSMRVAEIGYAFLCQEVENPVIAATMNTSYEFGPEIGSNFVMPFACQSKGVIQRFRKHDNSYASTTTHLSLPSSNITLPSQPKDGEATDSHNETTISSPPHSEAILPAQSDSDTLPKQEHNVEVSGNDGSYNGKTPYNNVSIISKWLTSLSLFLLATVIVGLAIYYCALGVKGLFLSDKKFGDSNLRAGASKRKKARKSGKSSGTADNDKLIASENGDVDDSNLLFRDLNRLVDSVPNGRRVGKLFVTNTEIAKGSNGTIVLEGIYEGRQVAVKRLVRTHHDVALKEIQNLIASDRHPNIVRWYGVENDRDFVYLSLERCSCSLDDLIQICLDSCHKPLPFIEGQPSKTMSEYKVRLDSVRSGMQAVNLWKANGHPLPLLLKLMRLVLFKHENIVHLFYFCHLSFILWFMTCRN